MRVGFGEEGVLAHKTMTLNANVLYKGREAAKSGNPCWFPFFLLLIRSLRSTSPQRYELGRVWVCLSPQPYVLCRICCFCRRI